MVGRLSQTEHLRVEAHINGNVGIRSGFEENGAPIGAELIRGLQPKYVV
jgi:hypothetical protein